MNQKPHSPEFKEQALRKLRERGDRTQQSVADELNICISTLKGWLQGSKKMARGLPHGANPLPSEVPALVWGASERLQALNESHALSGEALHSWCREKGLFAHQLQTWREAFLTGAEPMTGGARDNRSAVRELQSKNDLLERQLRRKDKALAEAAALLVLQKKFQALWADEV
jgi:transposase-like protein